MEPVELRVDDLLLRPWRPSDAEAVRQACQDPDIRRWTSVPNPYLAQHAEEFTGPRSTQGWSEGSAAAFGVFDAATGKLLASNGLITIDPRLRSAEIGYWTAPAARGRGVTARASRAIAAWAFDALELRRIVWQALVGNHASRLAALRAGFRMEGRLRLAHPGPDGSHEGWIGSLLPEDLDGEAPSNFGPDSLAARRAKVFGAEQPALSAQAPGGKITLHRPAERDIDAIVASCRDPESITWTTVPHPYQLADAEWFLRHSAGQWAAGAAGIFGLYDASDRYCGSFDLRMLPDQVTADVGYLVSPWARGQGHATTALRALCEWGFGQLALERIEWRAHVGNHASRRVAEKAGFVIEGVARAGVAHRGERRDCWVGAMLLADLS